MRHDGMPLYSRLCPRTAEQRVPPYVIFHDATLSAVARERSASADELAKVSGVEQSRVKGSKNRLHAIEGASCSCRRVDALLDDFEVGPCLLDLVGNIGEVSDRAPQPIQAR